MIQLFRFKLSVMVSLATAAGYVLVPGAQDLGTGLQTCVGVFLLSAGCSALNQVQERNTDRLQARTCQRPLARESLSPKQGLWLALCAMTMGLAALAWLPTIIPLLLGLGALLIYNVVYTPLKKVTPFALLPGSLAGATPAVIGWSAAGGQLLDYRIAVIAGLFVLWQIPHSWFLSLRYPEDVRVSPLAHILKDFSPRQVLRLAQIWIVCLGLGALLLVGLGIVSQPWVRIAISLLVCSVLGFSLILTGRPDNSTTANRLFICLNGFMAGMILCLITEGIVAASLSC